MLRSAHALSLAVLILGLPSAVRAATDDWKTFAHDDLRTAFQSQPTGITTSNVGSLALRWAVPLVEEVHSSPIVSGGLVYVSTGNGNVYALRTRDGTTAWKTRLGAESAVASGALEVRMTPALVGNMLLVGVHGIPGTSNTPPSGSSLQALDVTTGRVLWKHGFDRLVRTDPVVVRGIVYAGLAGGDGVNGCWDGRVITLDARTGKLLPTTWRVSSKPNNGGGIWGPLSTDGSTLYLGTGNTCDESGAQDSIVALSLPALTLRWRARADSREGTDEDVGSPVSIRGDTAYAEGKSGMVYAVDRRTGALRWRGDLHSDGRGGGGFGTVAGDGTMVMAYSGDGSSQGWNRHTKAIAFDLNGNEKYVIEESESSTPSLSASFIPGIGFLAVDRSIVAFDTGNGSRLWSYPTRDRFYASPAIVPSGLYDVDFSGNVYAFSLPSGQTPAGTAPGRLALITHRWDLVYEPKRSKRWMAAWSLAAAGGVGLFGVLLVRSFARRQSENPTARRRTPSKRP